MRRRPVSVEDHIATRKSLGQYIEIMVALRQEQARKTAESITGLYERMGARPLL